MGFNLTFITKKGLRFGPDLIKENGEYDKLLSTPLGEGRYLLTRPAAYGPLSYAGASSYVARRLGDKLQRCDWQLDGNAEQGGREKSGSSASLAAAPPSLPGASAAPASPSGSSALLSAADLDDVASLSAPRRDFETEVASGIPPHAAFLFKMLEKCPLDKTISIFEELGEGSYGSVRKAYFNERMVALKVVKRVTSNAYIREILALSQLRGSNRVAQLLDVGWHLEGPALVMRVFLFARCVHAFAFCVRLVIAQYCVRTCLRVSLCGARVRRQQPREGYARSSVSNGKSPQSG